MNIADTITAISVMIAAASFVYGVNAWKREFVGKRRLELLEAALEAFYEAEDAIKHIRNPFSWGGEGKTRKRAEYEDPDRAEILDQAYVVHERYASHKELFAKLRAMRYRFMAAFGPEYARPFDALNKCINEIFSSARWLGTHYWVRQGRVDMNETELEKHLEGMHKHEAIFWDQYDENDPIAPKVHAAVAMVEVLMEGEIAAQGSFWASITEWAREVMSEDYRGPA